MNPEDQEHLCGPLRDDRQRLEHEQLLARALDAESRAEEQTARAEQAEAEVGRLRECHDQLHAEDKQLRNFIAELTDTPAQWRLIAPSGHRQAFPREAIQAGAPWPDGWRMQTRDLTYGEWREAAEQPRQDSEEWTG